jgi:hypothetical protein
VSSDTAAAVVFPDVIAGRTDLRVVGELIESRGEIVDVAMRLLDSPFFECVQPDAFKITRRGGRQPILSALSWQSCCV